MYSRVSLIFLGIVIGAIIGCNGSATAIAPSTQTTSAPLYAVIKAPNGPTLQLSALNVARTEGINTNPAIPQAVSSTCAGLGTLSGRTGNILHGYSCTGYYFDISGCSTSSCTGVVQTLPQDAAILFDGQNCTGNMYLSTNITLAPLYGTSSVVALPDTLVPNGIVFRYQASGYTPTDPSTYWYVPAGESPSPDTGIVSTYQFNGAGGGSCHSASFPAGNGDLLYEVLQAPQLDPATSSSITDVPTAPVTGPVVIGTN